MKYLSFLAKCDWRFQLVLFAAFVAALVFLVVVLTRASKIDLPFMKVSMGEKRKRARKGPRGKA